METKKIFYWILLIIISVVHIQAQTQPLFISKPDLKFPNEAVFGRVVGKVWLKVLVGSDGIPVKTEIIKREPEMAYLFDNNSRTWGMQCKFIPATDDSGKPVSSWLTVPLSFRLDHFTPPQCINQWKPEYPREAKEMGMEGWVGLAVFVKSNGEVNSSETVVVAREPASASFFDAAAKEAAYHSQYIPAGYEGNSIDGWCFIKISFKISGNGIYDEQGEK